MKFVAGGDEGKEGREALLARSFISSLSAVATSGRRRRTARGILR